PLGASPTSLYVNSAGLTNNGTIIVDSGTWDSNASGAATYITNNGTITHNGDGWLSDPGLIMGPSGVVTYAGSTMTVYGVFNVSQGTFPNDLTVTFADDNNGQHTTITCGSVTFEQVIITKDNHSQLTIASDCTIPLGD